MAGVTPHLVWLGPLCAMVAFGAAQSARADEDDLRGQLSRLTGRTVFFGHQSVGMNVLEGVKELARSSGVALVVTEVPLGTRIPAGALGHAWVGENHRPDTKLKAFARAFDGLGADVDVALVKLCYVDFTPETNARALLARYQATLTDLQRRHPRTTFVHVTAPLSTVQGGVKGLAKRLLGKTPYGLVENVRREEYNALLRETYEGKEPLFDLARVEATAPDGSVETVTWNGRKVPALQPAYTEDGGHLNAEGRRRAARALVALLASLLESPSSEAAR